MYGIKIPISVSPLPLPVFANHWAVVAPKISPTLGIGRPPPGGCGVFSWRYALNWLLKSGRPLSILFVVFPFHSSPSPSIPLPFLPSLYTCDRRYQDLYSTRIPNGGQRSLDVEYQQQILVPSRQPWAWHTSLARCGEYTRYFIPSATFFAS